MLSLDCISKTYDNSPPKTNHGKANVLHEYSKQFTLPKTCVVGHNGSGKSTLLLIISGLLLANKGTIQWQQKPISSKQRKQCFAIASDSIVIPEFLSAYQVISLNQTTWKLPWPDTLIERFNFTEHLHKTIDALSAGNLKKLQLIMAIMREAPVLLLDEPNIALDTQSVLVLWDIIENYQGMIIAASNEPALFASKGFTTEALHNKVP